MKIKGRYSLFYAEAYKDAYWTSVAYADTPLGPAQRPARARL